ncbi:MAG: pyridoxamine 5'-phosphate oxidase family protein [Actinomycetota bacterium]|jgi:nitroimidazol reductase NimA-like FMN-containing flavoprotein (pyridoxamine 5'-phosphate oxidase superfamily)
MFLDTASRDPAHPAPLVERLDRPTCLALLATQSVGRVAVSRAGEPPHVVPVNYALLRDSIVFRTAPGTKLNRLITEPVTFEVDCFDIESRTGWSVVAQGFAYEASDREMAYEDVDLDCFLDQQTSRWACLQPDSLTGRRILRPSGRSRTSVPPDRDVRL